MTLNDDALRWMYRRHRPNWLAKILNRLSAMIGASGIALNYLVALEVVGRKSGRLSSFPVVVAVVGGQRYLVSMLGQEAQWVKNVRATDGKAMIHSGRRQQVRLEEVVTERRAAILKAYLQRAPGARPHMPVNKDAPLAEFDKIAADYPVFRIVPRPVDRISINLSRSATLTDRSCSPHFIDTLLHVPVREIPRELYDAEDVGNPGSPA